MLKVKGLYASYSPVPVMHDIDMEVGPGEAVAVALTMLPAMGRTQFADFVMREAHCAAARTPAGLLGQPQVVAHQQLAEQVAVLQHYGNAMLEAAMPRHMADFHPVQPRQRAHKRGLARAIGALLLLLSQARHFNRYVDMEFIIHCLDHADAQQRRLDSYDAHRAYLAAAKVRCVMCGPLMSDDGDRMIGSMFLVRAQDKRQVIDFTRGDPFQQAAVSKEVQIHPFMLRVDNRDPD
ncbi:YciI family protein [Cupriavidus sp. a3]|uniref:YciI family protein n=1 Tax=Cupriavidus sp. a3 TaxID=3242158 RepID=UPI003D9C20CE